MAYNVNELFADLVQCLGDTKKVMQKYHIDTDGVNDLDANLKDPDDIQKLNEIESVIARLRTACGDTLYLDCPVIAESTLHLNARGRYEDDIKEYTSGSGIEFLRDDGLSAPHWVVGRIEGDGEKYYIVHNTDVNYPHLKEGACGPAGLQFIPT